MTSDSKKVLFVDDDKFLLDMYALKFTKAGYDVKTSDATETAFKMIQDGYTPDIMLIDIIMPGMDGLDLLSNIRKQNLCKDTAFIFLTNQAESDDVSRAKKLNADGYIVKATTIPSEVLTEVEKIYSNKKK